MSILSKWRRRKQPYVTHTDEERIARYVYLLNTLPASVIEGAHAKAFADVPAAKRREMFDQLRPFMSDAEREAAADDPTVLARLVRRAEEHRARRAGGADAASATRVAVADDPRYGIDSRDLLMNAGVMVIVANQFLVSSAVASYFTVGAGSLAIEAEPAWVGATYDPVGTGWDPGAHGFDGGASGLDGGIGGFDGGFGGGFDGGGGFG